MSENILIIEPLKYFVEKHGVAVSNIEKIVSGQRYSAVLLKNGNIGVCANLLKDVRIKIDDLKKPELGKIEHRIILNAYFNGLLNYNNRYEKNLDIFEAVEFKRYKTIVMVGLFKPLLEKFKKSQIDLFVFDKIKQSSLLDPMKNEMEYIKKADAVILTATTIFNGTFMEILGHAGEKCHIFLLGPSAIMDKDMFRYKNIKRIFGAVFQPRDERVLDTIKQGFGTKKFIQFGRKVSL